MSSGKSEIGHNLGTKEIPEGREHHAFICSHELAEDQQATLNILPQMAGKKLQTEEILFIHWILPRVTFLQQMKFGFQKLSHTTDALLLISYCINAQCFLTVALRSLQSYIFSKFILIHQTVLLVLGASNFYKNFRISWLISTKIPAVILLQLHLYLLHRFIQNCPFLVMSLSSLSSKLCWDFLYGSAYGQFWLMFHVNWRLISLYGCWIYCSMCKCLNMWFKSSISLLIFFICSISYLEKCFKNLHLWFWI